MGNDIVKFFGNHKLPDAEKLNKALAGFSSSKASIAGGKALLRFIDGNWLFGIDNTEVKPGQLFVVDPFSAATGYVAWWMGRPEQEVMRPLHLWETDPININELPEVNSGGIPPGKNKPSGKGWEKQSSIDLMTKSDMPVAVQYKTSTKGGLSALMDLAGEMSTARAENPQRVYPIVELGAGGYQHSDREYGFVHTPMITVVGWLDAEGNEVKDLTKLGKEGLL